MLLTFKWTVYLNYKAIDLSESTESTPFIVQWGRWMFTHWDQQRRHRSSHTCCPIHEVCLVWWTINCSRCTVYQIWQSIIEALWSPKDRCSPVYIYSLPGPLSVHPSKMSFYLVLTFLVSTGLAAPQSGGSGLGSASGAVDSGDYDYSSSGSGLDMGDFTNLTLNRAVNTCGCAAVSSTDRWARQQLR